MKKTVTLPFWEIYKVLNQESIVEEDQVTKKGEKITITTKECIGNASKVYITYPEFPKDVEVGDKIMLDDGKLILRAESSNKKMRLLQK